MRNDSGFTVPTTRREFLRQGSRGIGLLAFSQFAPAFLTQTTLAGAPQAERDRSILVLVQLAGGNDGLNTVVPFTDDDYYRLRPRLGLDRGEVLPIADHAALHPSCGDLRGLFDDGRLAVVQNVGYPNPNRSHFRSMEIWESASEADDYLSTGWIGRFLDNQCAGAPADDSPAAVHVTGETPPSFYSETPHPLFGIDNSRFGRGGRAPDGRNRDLLSALTETAPAGENAGFLQQTLMDALVTERRVDEILRRDRAAVAYPTTQLARGLQSVAALIAAGMETRVYFVSQGGYDTHANQVGTHRRLLAELSGAMRAFQGDLEARKLDGQVLTATFSEFGRRASENVSGGTDHGTAAPLFVMGSAVRGGFYGRAPELGISENTDLQFSTDFRQVYATLLERWMGCDSRAVLGGRFAPVAFV